MALAVACAVVVSAQSPGRQRPQATLEAAAPLTFLSPTDSNSPAFWRTVFGQPRLVVVNSAPTPVMSVGPTVEDLAFGPVTAFRNAINGARWMEAVVPDRFGRLYGYYHNEPTGICPNVDGKTAPRIGAARSLDGGRTWTDLGIVLEAPPVEPNCGSANHYFAGGVGDFSVILDQSETDLYFLFSTYGPDINHQGVALARMLWGDRDTPQGRVATWSSGTWRFPEPAAEGWIYPGASPFLRAQVSWHDPSGRVDAFWGPSVHWNTFLKRYVVLLSRAKNRNWSQEGIYLSSTSSLDDPSAWTAPQKILDGGHWYPQVIGLEPGSGTDRLAGQRARFFMGGVSEYEIVFREGDHVAVPR